MNRILANVYLWLLLAILYAPIAIILIFSFTEAKVLGSWTGFSTGLYESLFKGNAGSGLNQAVLNTVIIAFVAATISTLLGSIAAIGIHSMKRGQRRVVSFVNSIPMINPDIITGISIFLLFVFLGIGRGLGTVICAHIAFCTPYVVLSVMPRLAKMNPNLYEAALDLGATPFVALQKVLIPEIKPGMLSGFILALTLSIDDFAVSLFTKGSGGIETLSTYIYADARKGGLTPELRPLFALVFLVILGLLIVQNVRSSRLSSSSTRLSSGLSLSGRGVNSKLKAIILVAAMSLPSLSFESVKAQERTNILKVYNWADYLDMDLIQEFEQWYEQQTGEKVKVVYQTFDINENMLTEIEVGHEDYDVVCPSEYIIERMLRRGLLQKIDTTDFAKTNTPIWLHNVSPWASAMFEKMSDSLTVADYSVGYMWGTTGILYNRKFVKDEEVNTWKVLQDPRFVQQIYVKDAFRDIYSVIIQAARYDEILAGKVSRQDLATNLTDENLLAVEQFLGKAKPNIAGWEADFGKERMCQGKVWMNATWSGDAQWAIDEEDEGVDLAYTVPDEGSNAWFDGWVIPIYAQNTRAASYWINFLCQSENAIRNMEETGYVSVIGTPEVLEAMKDEEYDTLNASYFFGSGAEAVPLNHVYYPDQSVIDRCILMHDTADRNEAMLEMWSHVKGDNLDWKMVTFILVVLGLVAFWMISRKYRKYMRRKHRRERLKRGE